MHPIHPMRAFACALAGLLAAGPACAQQAGAPTTPPAAVAKQAADLARGDPPRWYQDDVSFQQRLRTLRKEIGAAYAEAKIACRQGPAAERAGCLKDARATYRQDMAKARETAMASR